MTLSVPDAIRKHIEAVMVDEDTFDENGVSIDPAATEAAEKAECEAFIAFAEASCRSSADVHAKVEYLVRGTIGDRDSLIEYLQLRDMVEPFLKSLVGNPETEVAA